MSATTFISDASPVVTENRQTGRIKVVYIAGTVRSGSTVLGRLIAHRDNAIHLGEIKQLWIGIYKGYLCECKQPFEQCPFWGEVLRRAFGDIDNLDLEALVETTRYVDAVSLAPMHILSLPRLMRKPKVVYLMDCLRKLYTAIGEVSGWKPIVEGSKSPVYAGLINSIPDLDILPIHLIRDSRAVAFSLQRKKFDPAKPSGVLMPPRSNFRSAFAWNTIHAILDSVPVNKYQITVRYEDLCSYLDTALAQIPSSADCLSESSLSVAGLPILFDSSHSVAGNPMRFEREVAIKRDDEWSQNMRGSTRNLITALTFPILLRHGYRL